MKLTNNLKNNQNYIVWLEEKRSEDFYLYDTNMIDFLNSYYNKYSVINSFRLKLYQLLLYFGFNDIDYSKIKWHFWQINEVFYIRNNCSLVNIHKSFWKINIEKHFWITNWEIYNWNFISNDRRNLFLKDIVLVVEYQEFMNQRIFLNYIWKTKSYIFKLWFNTYFNYLLFLWRLSSIIFIFYLFSFLKLYFDFVNPDLDFLIVAVILLIIPISIIFIFALLFQSITKNINR